MQIAERWHLHPADVDPRGQRPTRARWFSWTLEMLELQERFTAKTQPPGGG